MISIKIDAERLLKAFRAAPAAIRSEMKQAMQTGIRDILKRARQEHRFVSQSGALERSMEGGIVAENPLTGEITAGGGKAIYARFIHEGTGLYGTRGERYPITPRFGRVEEPAHGPAPRKLLRWVGQDGKWHAAKLVMHPGVKPDPFLLQAAERELPHLETLFAGAIDRALDKEAT